jgi:hypothetical protein
MKVADLVRREDQASLRRRIAMANALIVPTAQQPTFGQWVSLIVTDFLTGNHLPRVRRRLPPDRHIFK